MNNLVKFFNENPTELYNLIPKNRESEFYEKIKKVALINVEKEGEPSLTQSQFIQVCLEINTPDNPFVMEKNGPIWKTKFGDICWN